MSGLEAYVVCIDGRGCTANVDGEVVRLTDIEYSLLEALLEADGDTVSTCDLVRAAYGHVAGATDGALRQRMFRLSRKLGKGAIRNVYGYGYRLTL